MPDGKSFLDVFRKPDEDKRRAQFAMQKPPEQDAAKSMREKLYFAATLGGKIRMNPDAIGVRGRIKNGHLYMPPGGGRINPKIRMDAIGEMVRPPGFRRASSDVEAVLKGLEEGNSIEALPIVTGLSQERVNAALTVLLGKSKVEGVV